MRKEIIVEDFSGGIANDIREQSSKGFAISQHFDNTTSPKKLVPFRDSEEDNTGQVGIVNFAWDSENLWGLGLTLSGGLKTQIYKKTSLTSAWTTTTNSTSATTFSDIANLCFIYRDKLYHANWTQVNSYNLDGSGYTEPIASAPSISMGGNDGSQFSTQGLIHSKTDTAYFGYWSLATGGRIWSISGTTENATALQLPMKMVPSAIAEYGSYLAILCRPVLGGGGSKIFLWDMVSADVTEVLDCGNGDGWILANVGGVLVIVMNQATSEGITFPTNKIFIKTYAGGVVSLFKTIEDTELTLGGLSGYKPFYSDIDGLTFSLISTGTKFPTGLYTFAKGAGTGYQLTSSRLVHNDTTITNVVGIYKVGDVVYTAYNYVKNVSSQVGRTSETEDYNNTAFIETVKYNCGSINKNKRLVGISVSHEPLTSGQTVTVLYRKDSQTSYTTIGSNTEVDSVFKEYITEGTVGKNLPEFHEIQFRIESTGGAVITGWRKVYEEKDLLLDNK